MYRPLHNDWTDREEIIAFCKAHPFAMLISVNPNEARPVATHIPVVVRDTADSLTCILHIARPNFQWKTIEDQTILLVFNGPHAYISPRGYEELDVPTWNYIAVHLYGTVRIITDNDAVRQRLQLLVEQHDDEALWPQLDPDHVEPLISGIVMMDITVTEIQGKRKMSQNRNAHDRKYGEQEVSRNNSPSNNDVTRP